MFQPNETNTQFIYKNVYNDNFLRDCRDMTGYELKEALLEITREELFEDQIYKDAIIPAVIITDTSIEEFETINIKHKGQIKYFVLNIPKTFTDYTELAVYVTAHIHYLNQAYNHFSNPRTTFNTLYYTIMRNNIIIKLKNIIRCTFNFKSHSYIRDYGLNQYEASTIEEQYNTYKNELFKQIEKLFNHIITSIDHNRHN